MKALVTALILITWAILAQQSNAHEFSGEISMENRFYPEKGLYGNNDQSELNLIIRPEYSHSWDDDRKVISFIPYARLSDPDNEKTVLDIREASFVGAWDNVEVRAGISKVFWGVTEGIHLVDIVNQTSFVENPDGEDKLGQPMINLSYIFEEWGQLEYYLLPLFRERTFPGVEGRYRTVFVMDTDNPIYRHEDEEKHIDHALRYSHSIGDLDFGLSAFKGTDREPLFAINSRGGFSPYYVQLEQFGVDLQYIWGQWLFKFEGIRKDREGDKTYAATATGFEYTFSNIWGGYDIGLLAEHYYDGRGNRIDAVFDNHTFAATRIAFNDERGTEILFGMTYDNEDSLLQSLRLESSRRINENWKWEFEINSVLETRQGQILNQFRNDDYAQLNISYFY